MQLPGEEVHRAAEPVASKPAQRLLRAVGKHRKPKGQSRDQWYKAVSFVPLIARLALGLAMFPHGSQKTLGWFGGYGFGGTMNFFTGQLHIPALFAFLAITAEFAGSIGLVTGFLSRVCAFGIAVTMLVATLMVHASNGFFMNWAGNQ